MPTELTRDVLAQFVGGELEVQNQGGGYLYRGEIRTITIDSENKLVVELAWNARGLGYPPLPTKGWVYDSTLRYEASLEIYPVVENSDSRIILNGWATGELVVLFPRNGSKLDQSKIKRQS